MKNTNPMIAENLKHIREQKGWSQTFVSHQLGISKRTISRAECGCGVSKHTLKMLCGLYQISVSSLYKDMEDTKAVAKEMQMVSDEVVVRLLMKHSFLQDLEQEVILRYTDVIQKEALMMREDVEKVISEALVQKNVYTLSDIIVACMMVNQKTLAKVRSVVIS